MLLPWRQILISSYRTRKNVNLNGDTQYLHSNGDMQPDEWFELRVQTLEESGGCTTWWPATTRWSSSPGGMCSQTRWVACPARHTSDARNGGALPHALFIIYVLYPPFRASSNIGYTSAVYWAAPCPGVPQLPGLARRRPQDLPVRVHPHRHDTCPQVIWTTVLMVSTFTRR